MKTLVGGAVAAVLGVIGLAVWFDAFLQLIAGTLPIILLIGGGLALYLGFDELKETWKNEEGVEVKNDQDRIAELEKELAELKKS